MFVNFLNKLLNVLNLVIKFILDKKLNLGGNENFNKVTRLIHAKLINHQSCKVSFIIGLFNKDS